MAAASGAHDERARLGDANTRRVTSGEATLADVYRVHHDSLVRLAAFASGDESQSEDIVHDAFVRVAVAWRRKGAPEWALAYVRKAVVNGTRSRFRRRRLEERVPAPTPEIAQDPAVAALGTSRQNAILAALRRLPKRQRQCVALRYYADLGEADIAEILGISVGSVKTHIHRALRTLESLVEVQDEYRG